MAEKQLSDAQVWDDSELLDSWNEAFEEYKKYHSLAAKGQKVKLPAVEAAEDPQTGNHLEVQRALDQEGLATNAHNHVETARKTQNAVVPAPGEPPVPPSMPQMLLGNGIYPLTIQCPNADYREGQNEDLKNLMMSWYYAGYYTGLYEGKQQGYADAMQHGNG